MKKAWATRYLLHTTHTKLARGFDNAGTAASGQNMLNGWLVVMRGCLKEGVLTFCRDWENVDLRMLGKE